MSRSQPSTTPDPDRCEVLIVGAGPAGAELARLLAQAGVDVLLIDRLVDLRQAAFSSAALPVEAVERDGLPPSVVAARWSGWQLVCGAVLDFGALRQWLADQAQGWGARLQLAVTTLGWCREPDGACTWVRSGCCRCAPTPTAPGPIGSVFSWVAPGFSRATAGCS